MTVGLFRRISSFILDALPILLIVSLSFTLLVGEWLKEDGYDALIEEYQILDEAYYNATEPYRVQLDNEEITQEEYVEIIEPDYNAFIDATEEHRTAIVIYIAKSALYHFLAFTVVYYLYSLLLKGATYGRKLMGIELGGRINWWTLFVREVLYKMFYWLITIFVLGIGIDIATMTFSKRKKAPRDFVSNTYVKFIGVDYPF